MSNSKFQKIDDSQNNPLVSSKWQLLVRNEPDMAFLRISRMLLGTPLYSEVDVMNPMNNPEYLLGMEMLDKYSKNILNIHGKVGVIDVYAQLGLYRRNHGKFVGQYLKDKDDLDMFMSKSVHNFICEGDDYYFQLLRSNASRVSNSNDKTSEELDSLVDASLTSVYEELEMTMTFPTMVKGVQKLRAKAKYNDQKILEELELDEYKYLRLNLYKLSAHMYLSCNKLFVMNEKNLELLPQLIAELHGKLVEVVSRERSAWFAPFVGRPALNRYIDVRNHYTDKKILTVHDLSRYCLGKNVFLTSSYTIGMDKVEREECGFLMEEQSVVVHFLMQVDLCTTFKYLDGPLDTSGESDSKAKGYLSWKKEQIKFRQEMMNQKGYIDSDQGDSNTETTETIDSEDDSEKSSVKKRLKFDHY